jgi:hypothetical protein
MMVELGYRHACLRVESCWWLQGFKALGDMILEEIMQDMTKIEWAVYQDYLAGRRVAPKRKPAWWESLPGAQPEKPRAKVE